MFIRRQCVSRCLYLTLGVLG